MADNRPINVLTCLFGFRQGGFYARYLAALRGLAKAGMQVQCVAGEPVPDAAACPGVTSHVARLPFGRTRPVCWLVFFPWVRRALARVAQAHPPSLALVFDGFYAWLLVPVLRQGGVPLVVFVRLNPRATGYGRVPALSEGLLRALRRRGLAAATRVVVQNAAIADIVAADFDVPRDRLRVLPNAIAPGRVFSAAEKRARRAALGLPETGLCVNLTARLARGKRPDLFLEAIRQLGERVPDSFGVVVGDGELKPAVAARAAQPDLAGRVHFLGWRDDARDVVGCADAFVLPTAFEGSSNALLEAMSMGVPCFASAIPENRSLLPREDLLFANSAAGVERLAAGLAALVDPARRRELGEYCLAESRAYVFDWEAAVVRIAQEVLAQGV